MLYTDVYKRQICEYVCVGPPDFQDFQFGPHVKKFGDPWSKVLFYGIALFTTQNFQTFVLMFQQSLLSVPVHGQYRNN